MRMQTESLARESTSNALASQKYRKKPHYEREKADEACTQAA
jgi:hypothetical protein